MILENEFNFNDEVYIIKKDDIIKTRVRMIKFPSITRFNPNPDNSIISYGLCTDEHLEDSSSIQETENWYDWRYANRIGKTKNELLDKLRDK